MFGCKVEVGCFSGTVWRIVMGLFGDLFDDVYEDGLHISRWGNRNKRSEGNYKNGKKEGLWTGWYENGQKRTKSNWRNGKREGLSTWWDENGVKEIEKNHKNGIPQFN